jgi:hypothetical protein
LAQPEVNARSGGRQAEHVPQGQAMAVEDTYGNGGEPGRLDLFRNFTPQRLELDTR